MDRIPKTVSGGDDPSESEQQSKKTEKKHGGLIQIHQKKDKKEKKEKKEKELRYGHLGEDSSGEEEVDGKSPVKPKLRAKPFMTFGSAKKDKEKKKAEKESKEAKGAEASATVAAPGSEKKKEKKEKTAKLKLIKTSKHSEAETEKSKAKDAVEESPIFGVALEVATARHKCHDGVALPLLVRQCVDFIEENALMQEGIYRVSGVKSKVNKLRAAYDSSATRNSVALADYEPSVVASVLKQFLRELPAPVLTRDLTPRFEKVSADPTPRKRIEGMKTLLGELPEGNRLLLQWVFVHMMHVVERATFNKMTLQNVSIVLSPTMQISHRVLNCLFENSHILFDGVQIIKYVPPITSTSEQRLPDTPTGIEEEIRKQESLLVELHLQISSGAASKKTEEQIWEQQRIVTQLKRKLRMVKKDSDGKMETKPKFEPIDYEEELDFSLQTPTEKSAPNRESLAGANSTKMVQETAAEDDSKPAKSPEMKSEDAEHKVSVMVHRSQEKKVTAQDADPVAPPEQQPQQEVAAPADKVDASSKSPERKNSLVTVIKLGPESQQTERKKSSEDATSAKKEDQTQQQVTFKIPPSSAPPSSSNSKFPLLPPPPPSTSNKMRAGYTQILRPTPASPPVPVRNAVVAKSDKSKSLPRGLPSDFGDFDDGDEDAGGSGGRAASLNPFQVDDAIMKEEAEKKRKQLELRAARDRELDELYLEECRARFEYEELMALKSELERRKLDERKEMEQLREELASMHTLYQYRTCSVDSSESSDEEAATAAEGSEGKAKEGSRDKEEEVEELSKVLSNLVRENKELETTKLQLCTKVQEERAACVSLRVQIRVEQERLKMEKMRREQLSVEQNLMLDAV